jgi:hypothetical protein
MVQHASPAQNTAGKLPSANVPTLPHQPRRHRRGLLLLGTLIMAGGGVLAAWAVNQLSGRELVIVMSREVSVGQEITRDDVSTTLVGADEGVATVPERELQQVIGMRAAVRLLAGTLLQRNAMTDQMSPAYDQQLVPVAVKPSRLPARGFQPGDPLLVITKSEDEALRKPAITAVVDQVKEPDTDGLVVVDLLVNSADGPKLASLAADGDVAMVLTPRRP